MSKLHMFEILLTIYRPMAVCNAMVARLTVSGLFTPFTKH